ASLYIHVPFCVKKCRYCDFHSQSDLLLIPRFVQALLKEIKYRSDPENKLESKQKTKIETIYFGGGTPSVLSIMDFDSVLQALMRSFQVAPEAEITVEVNPGTIDTRFLGKLKMLGVNRLSIGVQSFDEKKLKFLGRIHSVDQSKKILLEADKVGFDNIGFDLMYGLPFETEAIWQKDLETAIEFNPSHLSCYMLTIEEGTPLHADVKKGLIHPVSKEKLSRFFKITSRFLTKHRFDHYEISNFSRGISNRSRHNLNYWNMTPYFGFGPAAHSFDGQCRSWNRSDINLYINDIQNTILPVSDKETLTLDQTMLEMILLGLRTTQGVDLNIFYERFNIAFEQKFKNELDQINKEKLGSIKDNCFSLNLDGRLHLNSIIEAFADRII
ncbi:MAG: radical SAM family heme chaperone HemW, partial [Desulfobacula sp.]|nr:radical SAM family heme chaperone HemW [Desulfobacula sp.]